MADAPLSSNPVDLPEYTAEKLAENYPNRVDPLLLSGPYTPIYSARGVIDRLTARVAELEGTAAERDAALAHCNILTTEIARLERQLIAEQDHNEFLLKQIATPCDPPHPTDETTGEQK